MLTKHFNKKNRNEYGLSMIELLVVIVIIGILTSTATLITLNQRKKANEATVEADTRRIVTAIETALIDNPNATQVDGQRDELDPTNTITIQLSQPNQQPTTLNLPLSNGVYMFIGGSPSGGIATDGYQYNGYIITANHVNTNNQNYIYNSGTGTFKWETISSK